jgi:uncharacterized protein YjbI with pentapeptide repeats
VNELRLGQAIVLDEVTISGALDLSGVRTVNSIFKCQSCTFLGPVAAPDALFRRDVDMRDSRFVHGVNFSGAQFEGDAAFDDSAFLRGARFDSTAFGAADGFRDVRFSGNATFASTTFRRRADFSGTEFERDADFSDARLGGGATYLLAVFAGRGLFDRVSAGGDLDFTFGLFAGRELSLHGATVGGTLSFENAEFSRTRYFDLGLIIPRARQHAGAARAGHCRLVAGGARSGAWLLPRRPA